MKFPIVVAIAFLSIPPANATIHKAARTFGTIFIYQPVTQTNLDTFSLVSTSPKFYQRSQAMKEIYRQHAQTFRDIVKTDTEATLKIHAQPDFQLHNLQELDQAITAAYALEKARNIQFKTVWYLDFANLAGWLMKRASPKYVPIGLDPTRTVKSLDSRERAALAKTDLIFIPTCPATRNRVEISRIYQPALIHHDRIKLTDCMDAFVIK